MKSVDVIELCMQDLKTGGETMKKEIRYEELTLKETSGGYIVTACDKDAVSVVIPRRAWDIPIVAIGDRAFEDCTALESVVFSEPDWEEYLPGDELTEIGEYAFSGCAALHGITLPDSVSVVWRGAFYGCEALKTVEFSKSPYFAPYVFARCSQLVSVSPLKNVSEGLFYDCKALESAEILTGCEEIDEDAFEHCEALSEITIPASVKRIDGLAFRSCYALSRVTFEETDGWQVSNRYTRRVVAIDVSDPEENARDLKGVDFDDGIVAWYRKRGNHDEEDV